MHVVCHECGGVVEVSHDVESVVDELERRLLHDKGFSVDRSHLTIFGTCAECRAHRHGAPRDEDAEREQTTPDER